MDELYFSEDEIDQINYIKDLRDVVFSSPSELGDEELLQKLKFLKDRKKMSIGKGALVGAGTGLVADLVSQSTTSNKDLRRKVEKEYGSISDKDFRKANVLGRSMAGVLDAGVGAAIGAGATALSRAAHKKNIERLEKEARKRGLIQ